MNPSHPSTTCERLAWQAYADACLEHDRSHARRAADEVIRVVLPQQRPCRAE